MVEAEADLPGAEVLRGIDIADRDGNDLELHVYDVTLPTRVIQASCRRPQLGIRRGETTHPRLPQSGCTPRAELEVLRVQARSSQRDLWCARFGAHSNRLVTDYSSQSVTVAAGPAARPDAPFRRCRLSVRALGPHICRRRGRTKRPLPAGQQQLGNMREGKAPGRCSEGHFGSLSVCPLGRFRRSSDCHRDDGPPSRRRPLAGRQTSLSASFPPSHRGYAE